MRSLAVTTLAALAALPAPAVALDRADRRAAVEAARWLAAQPVGAMEGGQRADTIVALRRAGTTRRALRPHARALARVAPTYGRGAGPAAKVVLAARALGARPTAFGRVNYLRRVRATYRRGRFGRTLFDHCLAVIALRTAGQRVPAAAIRELRRARGRGGWNLAMGPRGSDEVDATGLAIRALRAAGVPRTDRDLRAATAWLRNQQNTRGGYGTTGRISDANSTAAALLALRAMGRTTTRTRRELRSLQLPNGSFAWRRAQRGSTLLATTDAVVALSR